MGEAGRQLIEELMRFKPDGLTANAWAVQAGVGRTIWADLRRHGNPSRRTLSKLLEAAGSSLAEFEALRVGAGSLVPGEGAALADLGRTWRPAPSAWISLYELLELGVWDQDQKAVPLLSFNCDKIVERLPKPRSLAGDGAAYALIVTGQSMWPRFRAGRRIAVSPAASVTTGDDVLVALSNGRGALVGELQSNAGSIKLRQFNPLLEFDVAAAEVEAIHKIIGELI
jgi:hypothetical protein